ncbi:MAG: hypothetical protein L0177_18265 [Chloroflexi bacterium]|nr:hypothetical protein [Chloroflexota bacterium]
MDLQVVKQLMNELVGTKGMLVVIDSGGAIGEMHPRGEESLEFDGDWATLESRDWHVHLDMRSVDGAQFVEADDTLHTFPKTYYVRLSDASEVTLMRFYFPNPWLDEDEKPAEFQPEKLRLFEELRDRYAGRGGIVFVRRQDEKVRA